MQIYKTIIKNSKYFKIDGSNVGKNNLFNQYMEYIVLDPTSVGPSSVLTLNQLNALKMTSSDNFYVTAASFTDTAWTSGGWDMSTDANFQAQLNTWLLANITDALYEKGLCATIVTRGTVTLGGSTLYTLVFLYAGNVGTLVTASNFKVEDIEVGYDHLILKADYNKKIYARNINTLGNLGDLSIIARSSPVSVSGGISFSKLAGGYKSSLAIEGSTGYVWAWGNNSFGQLGTQTTNHTSSPISIVGGISFKEISGGNSYISSGIEASTGYIWSWGHNSVGQLGDNTTIMKSSPVSLLGGRSYVMVSNGHLFNVGLEGSTGYVYGWGTGGTLGAAFATTGVVPPKSSPIKCIGGGNSTKSFVSICAGNACQLVIEGSTGYAWVLPDTNTSGQMGHGTTSQDNMSPVLGNLSYKSAILDKAVGTNQHCTAIEASTGRVWTWGNNSYGCLGDGTTSNKSSPISVLGGRSFSKIGCFNYSVYALEASSGVVWAWGYNTNRLLGDGTTLHRSSPVSVNCVFPF